MGPSNLKQFLILSFTSMIMVKKLALSMIGLSLAKTRLHIFFKTKNKTNLGLQPASRAISSAERGLESMCSKRPIW
uniref:Uncharacterized protein n=1 Tax=Romanomermis culicivorax TaxID=13658 RepID=A0A915JTW2_ROMCU